MRALRLDFKVEYLKAAAAQNWYLVPCIYDYERQRAVISALVEEVMTESC